MFIIGIFVRSVVVCLILGGAIVAILIGWVLHKEKTKKTRRTCDTLKRQTALLDHWSECIACKNSLRGQSVDRRGIPHFEGCLSHSGRDWSRR
jgi:hypothetical protein